MRKMFIHLIIFIVIFVNFPSTVIARTGYVSDMLLLTFRQGPGSTYKVLRTLKSNTALIVLEEEEGFLKVELQSGDIGWVDKKFVIFKLPSAYVVKQLEAKNQALETKINKFQSSNQTLDSTLSELKNKYATNLDSLKSSLEKVQAKNKTLSESFSQSRKKHDKLVAQSKNILKIVEENKVYQRTNQSLSKDLDTLQIKQKNNFRTGMIKWFFAGVGVLLAGWIMGNGVSSKRRSSSSLLD